MKAHYVIFLAVLVAVSCGYFPLAGTALCQENNILTDGKIPISEVIILDKKHGITKPEIRIKKGTTVVWSNATERLMEVKFTSKQIRLVCSNPKNFIVDVDGTFVSKKITRGAVASICFIEEGVFDYMAVDVSRLLPGTKKNKSFKGTIIVH